MNRTLWGMAFALLLALSPSIAMAGPAGGTKLAYFQSKNIFHSGLQKTHTVALTFDDGPNANTPAVLEALKALGVKGTFLSSADGETPSCVLRASPPKAICSPTTARTHPLLGERVVDHPDMLLDQIRQVDE